MEKYRVRPSRPDQYAAWLQSMEGEEAVYKSTLNAQTYIDIRALASIDKFLRAHGILVRTTSEALREVVQMALTTIKLEGGEIETSVEEAVGYLTARGYSMKQFEGMERRQGRRLATAMQAEAYAQDRRGQTAPPVQGVYVPPVKECGLFDGSGQLLNDTRFKLYELGYCQETGIDAVGSGLPQGVMEILRTGKYPPPCEEFAATNQVQQSNRCAEIEESVRVPQAPLDRPETLEEAQARREAEAAREKAAMLKAIRARRGGIDNAKD